MPLRVLLADDHLLFRQGLAIALDAHDGIETVAWVPNDDEVPELARELRPDVVVMEARVSLEEAGASLDRMRAFLKLGASGYVTKISSTAVLVAAIRAAGDLGGRRGGPLPRTCSPRRISVRTGRTATPSPAGTNHAPGAPHARLTGRSS